jgi:hypothetical protein
MKDEVFGDIDPIGNLKFIKKELKKGRYYKVSIGSQVHTNFFKRNPITKNYESARYIYLTHIENDGISGYVINDSQITTSINYFDLATWFIEYVYKDDFITDEYITILELK